MVLKILSLLLIISAPVVVTLVGEPLKDAIVARSGSDESFHLNGAEALVAVFDALLLGTLSTGMAAAVANVAGIDLLELARPIGGAVPAPVAACGSTALVIYPILLVARSRSTQRIAPAAIRAVAAAIVGVPV